MPNLAGCSHTGLHLFNMPRWLFLACGLCTCWSLCLECSLWLEHSAQTTPHAPQHNLLHILKYQLLRNIFYHHPFNFPYHITLYLSFSTLIATIIIYCLLVYYWSLPRLMVSSMRQGSDTFYKLYPGPGAQEAHKYLSGLIHWLII